ncbi:MAG: AbrB family looped-hinge helix DNA binding protein [Paracoccaceae bacterium]|jgi:AbrB family looped-hinge helix DNA binding protein
MTTVLSQKGQVVIPAAVRKQLKLEPGDDLEVTIRDDRSVILERVTKRPNEGLYEALTSIRHLEIELALPPREVDESREIPFQGDGW